MRAFSPLHLSSDQTYALYSRIACPTLLIRGTESWASDPIADGRASHFANARVENVEQAGHWVHHDQLDVFLRLTRAFLEESA